MSILAKWFDFILCYTESMEEQDQIQGQWVSFLHRWGLNRLTADLIEAFGPFSIVGAQLLHFSKPISEVVISSKTMEAIVQIAENEPERLRFVTRLRNGTI